MAYRRPTVSNTKSTYKSQIVTSDNYEVTLYYLSKCLKSRPSVLTQHAAVHATGRGRLPCRWRAAADQTTQQSRSWKSYFDRKFIYVQRVWS